MKAKDYILGQERHGWKLFSSEKYANKMLLRGNKRQLVNDDYVVFQFNAAWRPKEYKWYPWAIGKMSNMFMDADGNVEHIVRCSWKNIKEVKENLGLK